MAKAIKLALVMAQSDYRKGRDTAGNVLQHPAGASYYELAESPLTAEQKDYLSKEYPLTYRRNTVITEAMVAELNTTAGKMIPQRVTAEIVERSVPEENAETQNLKLKTSKEDSGGVSDHRSAADVPPVDGEGNTPPPADMEAQVAAFDALPWVDLQKLATEYGVKAVGVKRADLTIALINANVPVPAE